MGIKQRRLQIGEVVRVSGWPLPGARRRPGIIAGVQDGVVRVRIGLQAIDVAPAQVSRVRDQGLVERYRTQIEGIRAAARSLSNAARPRVW